jgi:hypothetical protein
VTASVDELVRRLSEDGVRIDEPFVAQALDQLVERGRVAHRPSYGYWILDEGAPPATVWESEPTNLDEIESRKWG